MVEANVQSEQTTPKQAYPRVASIFSGSTRSTRCALSGMFADADSETPNGERVPTPMNPNGRAKGQQTMALDGDKGGKRLKSIPR